MSKAKKKAAKRRPRATATPLYDQLVAELGFAPHRQPSGIDGWRNHPAAAGLLEDNFS